MADRCEEMATKLCEVLGVEPFSVIPKTPERRFLGYEGDYFMNWARDQAEFAMAIEKAAAAVGDRESDAGGKA